jgi:hypothetical protein
MSHAEDDDHKRFLRLEGARNTDDDQITQLAALRDQGLLTDEEFAARKADLLSRM